jgi:hypothetical protein
MSRLTRIFIASALLFQVAGSGQADAQSALSLHGLGLPVEPMDARARALGGTAIGLSDGEISWVSPGSLFGLPAPAMVAAYQYDRFETTGGVDPAVSGTTARFPFLFGAFPAGGRVVVFGGFGAFLDQNWRVATADTITFGSEDVPVIDISSSQGGVSRARLGATYLITEGLAVGGAIDLFTGSVDRVQGRVFPGESNPACCRTSWNYQGQGFTGGVHWAPSPESGIALSASYGGKLEADPKIANAEPREYELPLMIRGGASARVGQNSLLAINGSWDGWSSLEGAEVADPGARDSWSVGGGLEWDGLRVRGNRLPLRLGARTADLPFRWQPGASGATADFADERAITGGAGLLLGAGTVRGDVSFEKGTRSGGASDFGESFWRVGFSIRVLGR